MLHGKHSFEKEINEMWYQACDLIRFIQQPHIYILHQAYEYNLSHAAGVQVIVEKSNVFSSCEINAIKLGTKIWFRLDCIMQLK